MNKANVSALADKYIAADGKQPSNAELDAEVALHDHKKSLEKLGQLSPAEYGRRRDDLAADLGTPLGFLDAEWKEQRKRGGSSASRDLFAPVEPWPSPVDGDQLLHDLSRRLKRYVIFREEAATAAALWTAFAWTHEAAVHSPIFLATSVEANSGKTTLLAVIRFLAPRALMIVEISEAVLYRAIEKWNPTLIVDEADVIFRDNSALRGVVNSGWTRGSGVPRCHPETHEPEIFSTFGPKAIGMKGKNLPDTTLSRAVVIEMQRKKPGERADSFEHIDDDESAILRRKLARWAADNLAALRTASPQMPDGFENRLASNWRPLLAVADAAGGEWPELARKAAKALSVRETESTGTMLLADIKAAFDDAKTNRMASAELCEALHKLEGRPWAEFGKTGKPITPNQLARMVRPFGVSPDNIYLGGGRADAKRPKGYLLERFNDAFDRYLSREGVSEPLNRYTPTATGLSGTFQTAQPENRVADRKCEKPASNGRCSGLAVENTLAGLKEAETDALDDFNERSAVLEYDGGLPRDEAEAAARREINGGRT